MLADVFDHDFLTSKLRRLYDGYKKRYGDLLEYDVEDEIARFKCYAEKLRPYVVDEVPLLRSAKILVEGAQAIIWHVSACHIIELQRSRRPIAQLAINQGGHWRC